MLVLLLAIAAVSNARTPLLLDLLSLFFSFESFVVGVFGCWQISNAHTHRIQVADCVREIHRLRFVHHQSAGSFADRSDLRLVSRIAGATARLVVVGFGLISRRVCSRSATLFFFAPLCCAVACVCGCRSCK